MAESDGVVTESRSSVKIGQNAKGEPVIEVKVYDNFEPDAVKATQAMAVELYEATVLAVGG